MLKNIEYKKIFQELDKSIPDLHEFLEELANIFGLTYKKSHFEYLLVSPEQKTLLDFLGGCPAPPHDKWSSNIESRVQNIDSFISDQDFTNYVKNLTIGGSALESGVGKVIESLTIRPDHPEWVMDLYTEFERLGESRDKAGALLFVSDKWDGSLKTLQTLLIHEWIHLLFFKNSIEFQKSFPHDDQVWLYDEGLATWAEGRYVTGRWDISHILLNQVKRYVEQGAPVSVYGYYATAYWLSESFNNVGMDKWPIHLKGLLKKKDLMSSAEICSEVKTLAEKLLPFG